MPPTLDPQLLKLVIESVLFVADGPVELRTLARLTEQTPEAITQAIAELSATSRERGVRIQQTGQSAQMVSAPETASYVQRYLGIDENQRLSPVVLVTLTVIAYKQPVTKGDVERILRKNCEYSVMVLKARDLINEVGRAEGPGRPYLYGTTFKFLEHFGLEKPEDLPPLPELEVAAALAAESAENGNGVTEETGEDEATPTDEAAAEDVAALDTSFAEAAEAPGA